jgi:hypothetical protein
MTQSPISPPSPLENLLEHLTLQGWRVHNLYQGTNKWEARIKLASSTAVYGNGEGPTPYAALSAALANGIVRRDWRPFKPQIPSASAPPTPRSTTSTDDLMKDLDL